MGRVLKGSCDRKTGRRSSASAGLHLSEGSTKCTEILGRRTRKEFFLVKLQVASYSTFWCFLKSFQATHVTEHLHFKSPTVRVSSGQSTSIKRAKPLHQTDSMLSILQDTIKNKSSVKWSPPVERSCTPDIVELKVIRTAKRSLKMCSL